MTQLLHSLNHRDRVGSLGCAFGAVVRQLALAGRRRHGGSSAAARLCQRKLDDGRDRSICRGRIGLDRACRFGQVPSWPLIA
jgi:hypothetical protein